MILPIRGNIKDRFEGVWLLPKAIIFAGCLLLFGCSKKAEERNGLALHITGKIQIEPNFLKYTKKSDTLFLIARSIEGGPPIAVTRFSGKNYPYDFSLSEEHLMIPGKAISEPLNLTVRVDKDGNALTKNAGDIEGAYEKNPVSLHAENIIITVNKILK